jgi:hypothetical protein
MSSSALRPQERRLLLSRLRNQRLQGAAFSSALELLDWMGPIQAQDYFGALWAIACRSHSPRASDLEASFNEGSFLRVHLLRPTWHLVLAKDLRWISELSGPSISQAIAPQMKKEGIDTAWLRRAKRLLLQSLEKSEALSRPEIVALLERARLALGGQRLVLLLMQLESELLICSGPRQGKDFSYSLVERRVPPRRSLAREDAVAQLALLYLRSRGPATLKDFEWWSGLSTKEAKLAFDAQGTKLQWERLGELDYAALRPDASSGRMELRPRLLPNYDEYVLAYSERRQLLKKLDPRKLDSRGNVLFHHGIFHGGELIGLWRPLRRTKQMRMETRFFVPLPKVLQSALQREKALYAAFWDLKYEEEGKA